MLAHPHSRPNEDGQIANGTSFARYPIDCLRTTFAIKILEEQQGWNDGRKFDQFIDERPKPLRFTEGDLEWGCVREQSQATWAGE
jgi:hypothetical protein